MEIYVSVDIETDGPIPGDNSMLQLGAAAFTESGRLFETFSANIRPLPDACADHKTMKFWDKHPELWEKMKVGAVEPEDATRMFTDWLDALEGSLVFVGYPAAFDFGFTHWYTNHFMSRDPFGFSALDIKTYAMAALGTKFKATTKRNMPRRWFDNRPHTHVALDDALEQGRLFFAIRNELRAKP